MCDDGLFGDAFDFNGDGELDAIERTAEFAYLSDDDDYDSWDSDDDDDDDWDDDDDDDDWDDDDDDDDDEW